MAHTTNTITAPVVMPTDLAAVLGISGTDLATACKSSVINPWAKYKPVRWAHIDNTKDPSSGTSWLNSDKTWNSLATWWKYTGAIVSGIHRQCGFLVPSTDVSTVDELGGWTYEQPTGGASQPYRLTDFNQYFHGAVVPFRIDIPARIIKDGNVTRGRVQARILDHPTINNLGLTLFDIISPNVKLGIALIKSNGAVYSKIQASTSDNVISLEGLQSYVSVGDTVRIVAFATTHSNSSWNVDDYTVYGLDAPNIDFATSASVKVIATLQTVYQIAVTGITAPDWTVLRPGPATLSTSQYSSRVVAPNRNQSGNPTYSWEIINVYCDVYKCSADGTSELYDSRTYTQAQTNAEPSFIAHNDGPYSQLYCDDVYPFSTLPTIDPTEYYWQIRYTFEYDRA